MVASKRPYGRRLLLPTEVEFCNLLGISEDEYWYFQDQVAFYNGKRPEGYELIPDIRCEPVSALATALGYAGATQMFVQIGIAVGLATLSYLLAPKPQEQKQGGSRRTADSIGNRRFSPQSSFNSIQELAAIGEPIPLVFTHRLSAVGDAIDAGTGYGGLRVNGQLLWSQLESLDKYLTLIHI